VFFSFFLKVLMMEVVCLLGSQFTFINSEVPGYSL